MTNFFSKKLNKRGFTLAELLIVVAILAILIAVAIPIYTGVMQDAQKKVNQSNARALKGAATSYILTHWTEDDGTGTSGPAATPGPKYSTGADGDNPGWYAWAYFDDAGNMGKVYVKVDKTGANAAKLGVKSVSTDPAGTCPTTDLKDVNDSGSVTNPNVIIVHLTGTDIGK